MGWVISNFEPVYVDDVAEESMDCMMCPYEEKKACRQGLRGSGETHRCYWDEVWSAERSE